MLKLTSELHKRKKKKKGETKDPAAQKYAKRVEEERHRKQPAKRRMKHKDPGAAPKTRPKTKDPELEARLQQAETVDRGKWEKEMAKARAAYKGGGVGGGMGGGWGTLTNLPARDGRTKESARARVRYSSVRSANSGSASSARETTGIALRGSSGNRQAAGTV
jgi:hypothetical protein